MEKSEVHIGFVQMACSSSVEENIAKAEKGIADCAKKGADLICLQELFASLYFCHEENPAHFDLAEAIPGPLSDRLCQSAAANNVAIVGSLFEKRTKGIYHNTAVVISNKGEYLGKYRKMHIPDDPGYYEKYYFTPGDLGFKVFDTGACKAGTLICWDQWFPEAARITSLMGADILFYPTAIGWAYDESEQEHSEQLDAWIQIQRAHAIANGVFVVAVNRVGKENGQAFWGHSMVINPFGQLIYSASSSEEENTVVSIDLNEIEKYRRQWPFLRDRRIESYQPITNRHIDE